MSQTEAKLDPNQRIAPRSKSLIAARITFNNGQSTLDCLVRNLSETGAKLVTSAAVSLPERFDLFLSNKSVTHRARIVWRRGEEIGVRFEDAQPPSENSGAADEGALKQRIRELEAEVARLQSRILQLTDA